MKTVIGTLTKDGFTEIDRVNFNTVQSDDPIAYYFGSLDAKSGKKLPPKRSKEYRELAAEYIRGFTEATEK